MIKTALPGIRFFRGDVLIQALDYEWNKHWCQMANINLIVCGSAASWMLSKLVHSRGGLYNRITGRIHLRPFSLLEADVFLRSRGIRLKPEQVLELYMVLGGIPFYLRYVERGRSVSQIVDELCFRAGAPLRDEFDRLFASLFEHARVHETLIREIARKREGLTRNELVRKTGMRSGGSLKHRLDELESSSFIERYVPHGKTKKNYYIKVIDEYSLFYLHWIEPMRSTRSSGRGRNYWSSCTRSASYQAWRGYAFEAVCTKHVDSIIRALGLETVASTVSGWRAAGKGRQRGAQIDLLIDRTDNAMTLCEMKFSNAAFRMDRATARELAERMETFEQATGTRKQLFQKYCYRLQLGIPVLGLSLEVTDEPSVNEHHGSASFGWLDEELPVDDRPGSRFLLYEEEFVGETNGKTLQFGVDGGDGRLLAVQTEKGADDITAMVLEEAMGETIKRMG